MYEEGYDYTSIVNSSIDSAERCRGRDNNTGAWFFLAYGVMRLLARVALEAVAQLKRIAEAQERTACQLEDWDTTGAGRLDVKLADRIV